MRKSKSAKQTVKELLEKWNLSDTIKEINNRTLSDDLLTLSCCLHRINIPFMDIGDAVNKITAEDRILADKIKIYYQQKLLLSSLNGKNLTAFRLDLYKLIHDDFYVNNNDQYVYPDDMIGLAYRLPDFYAYDIAIEEIFGGKYAEVKNGHRYTYEGELTFVRKIINQQRKVAIMGSCEFWFKNKYDEMVLIGFNKNNKLIPFFEKAVEHPITVTADLIVSNKDNIQYYRANDWSLI